MSNIIQVKDKFHPTFKQNERWENLTQLGIVKTISMRNFNHSKQEIEMGTDI